MTPDGYLHSVLKKYALPADHRSQVQLVTKDLYPYIRQWAGARLLKVQYSGSFAKGTTVRGGTDVDLFISLKHSTNGSLHDIYQSLYSSLISWGLKPRRQNVSIGLTLRGLNIDLVPARQHSGSGQDHSLYRNRTGSWTKTNVARHIQLVRASRRTNEIRALKIWRQLHGLEFPSIYLELVAINALRRKGRALAPSLIRVFEWLATGIQTANVVDPANTANVISDDLTFVEKGTIASRAAWSVQQPYWEQILW